MLEGSRNSPVPRGRQSLHLQALDDAHLHHPAMLQIPGLSQAKYAYLKRNTLLITACALLTTYFLTLHHLREAKSRQEEMEGTASLLQSACDSRLACYPPNIHLARRRMYLGVGRERVGRLVKAILTMLAFDFRYSRCNPRNFRCNPS